MEGLESSRQNTESKDQIAEKLFHNRRRCFSFNCFSRNSSFASSAVDSPWWRKIRTARIDRSWTRSVAVLMKIREWSEIVAGPRWKTFIRRFNRNRNKHVNFQYDPLSYAMNFDEGPGQNGHFDEAEEEGYARNFSSRYANGSIDGTVFV